MDIPIWVIGLSVLPPGRIARKAWQKRPAPPCACGIRAAFGPRARESLRRAGAARSSHGVRVFGGPRNARRAAYCVPRGHRLRSDAWQAAWAPRPRQKSGTSWEYGARVWTLCPVFSIRKKGAMQTGPAPRGRGRGTPPVRRGFSTPCGAAHAARRARRAVAHGSSVPQTASAVLKIGSKRFSAPPAVPHGTPCERPPGRARDAATGRDRGADRRRGRMGA